MFTRICMVLPDFYFRIICFKDSYQSMLFHSSSPLLCTNNLSENIFCTAKTTNQKRFGGQQFLEHSGKDTKVVLYKCGMGEHFTE